MYFRFILFTAFLSIRARIINYSDAEYIPIYDGDIMVWEEYGYMKHTVNLTLYDEIIRDTGNLTGIFPQSHMKKILSADVNHISTLLSALKVHHRHSRSLNLLGTGLKIIAGTPDFDDFEKVKFTQQQLAHSNNRQIEINAKITQQLHKLTDVVNSIMSESDKNRLNTEHLYETLLARNRMTVINLQNLILSISLAKSNIIDLSILDSDEVDSVVKGDDSTGTSVSEVMVVSSIKILQNNEILSFIIKFPRPKQSCKKISLFPVSHHKKIISFKEGNIVAKCGNQITAVEECRPSISSTFCKLNMKETCAKQIMSNAPAKCNTEFDLLDKISVVDDGIIILNNVAANVTEAMETHSVQGTYLILFENEVTINFTKYVNRNGVTGRSPELANIQKIEVIEHEHVLSLPYLHEMHIQNLEHLQELKKDIVLRPILSTTAFIIIVGVCFILFKICRNVKERRELTRIKKSLEEIVKKTEDGLHSKGGIVNNS